MDVRRPSRKVTAQDLYRRTMYTFWKRTSPPPTLVTFDAPGPRNVHGPPGPNEHPSSGADPDERPDLRGGLPQAGGTDPDGRRQTADERITFAFRLAMARSPTAGELAVLRKIAGEQLDAFRKDVAAAAKLLDGWRIQEQEQLDPAELAAWAMLSSVILNLDETVTKG